MEYVLAEANIARLRAPLDDPSLADFVNNLDRINQLAEDSPGFIWRLQTEDGNATALRVFDDDQILVNLSVWENRDSLFAYVYKSQHVDFFRRRREWFEKLDMPIVVMWWIPANHRPTLEEAKNRLEHLQKHGPTPYAFTFKERFEPA